MGRSSTEGRNFNSYRDPKVGKSLALQRQRRVSGENVSGNEEAIRRRGLPQQVGTKSQVSEVGDSQYIWVNTMVNTGKQAKPVTSHGCEPTGE